MNYLHPIKFLRAGFVCASVYLSAPVLADTFSFQGALKESGASAVGPLDLAFRLYDDELAGVQVGLELTLPGFTDFGDGGEFTVDLDFGPGAFPGAARWLEVWVDGAPLSPRQPVNPTPYAMHAQSAAGLVDGGLPAAYSNQVEFSNAANSFAGEFSGSFGGSGSALTNLNASSIASGTLGAARLPTGGSWGLGSNLNSDNATLVVDSLNNAIGIGTSTPERLLHVKDGDAGVTPNSNSRLVVERDNSTFINILAPSANQQGILFGNAANGSAAGGVVYNSSNTPDGMQFRVNGNSAKMTILANGRVGIGTTEPVARLEVSGTERAIHASSTLDHWTVYVEHPAPDSGSLTAAIYSVNAETPERGVGVQGRGGLRGVWGEAGTLGAGDRFGVYGQAYGGTGTHYGVYGIASGGYGVYSDGAMHVAGTLSKSGGAFRIDHPLDPENKELWHSFVESPDMMNIYNGNVTTDGAGYAVVTMPEWFDALNREFRYQLTVLDDDEESFALAKVLHKLDGGQFTIKTSEPFIEVSWQVTGVRRDPWAEANRIPVEKEKRDIDKGLYLSPEAYGLPPEKGVDWRHSPGGMEQRQGALTPSNERNTE